MMFNLKNKGQIKRGMTGENLGIAEFRGAHAWQYEPDIRSEVGVYIANGRVLDLVVTPTSAGNVEADVVEAEVLWRRRFPSIHGAMLASIRAARRILDKKPHDRAASRRGA